MTRRDQVRKTIGQATDWRQTCSIRQDSPGLTELLADLQRQSCLILASQSIQLRSSLIRKVTRTASKPYQLGSFTLFSNILFFFWTLLFRRHTVRPVATHTVTDARCALQDGQPNSFKVSVSAASRESSGGECAP